MSLTEALTVLIFPFMKDSPIYEVPVRPPDISVVPGKLSVVPEYLVIVSS